MRRAILLLLALALLLSGCVRKQEQPSLRELLKLDELSSLAAPPAEEPLPPQTAGDPLPSTGVWVDESVYTPRERVEAIFTRPEGDLSRYVPGQGTVYPYCAGENQYGFCSADGTLVTDPIYEQMGVLYDYDSRSDSPFYTVMPHPSGPDDWPKRGAVAADGSFVIDCAYDSVYLDEGDIKCTRGEMAEDYDLYDRQGHLLLSAKGLDYTFSADFPEERRGDWFLVYSYTDSSPENYYVNADSRRLGPYFYTYPFSEGLACVSEDGHTFGYIDETGAWAITPRYNMSFTHDPQFRNGRAIQNTDDGDVLIDKAGNILIACHSNCLHPTADGYYVQRDDVTENYDRDGSLLSTEDVHGYYLDDDVLCVWDESGYTLRSISHPDRQAHLPAKDMSPMRGAIYTGGRFRKGYVMDDRENAIRYFVSEDLLYTDQVPLEELERDYEQRYRYGLFHMPEAGGVLNDLWTGELYYTVYASRRVLIFSEDGALLWSGSPNAGVAIFGGRLGVVTDRDCAYYEQDGSVSFRFPFFVLPDD